MLKQPIPPEHNEAMFKFISQVITMAKEKEVFNQIHLKDVDTTLYMEEMNKITATCPTELVVRKNAFKLETQLFAEKSKKKPNLDKVRKVYTLYRVYSDALDFMISYIDMRYFKLAALLDRALRRIGNGPESYP
jgi:uncharacterized membrane protein